ncbi:CIS tube protein [Chryseobacterium gambrini]|uniref:CIS tube protein n=1 Tax=Chryseobacterium gambrini TaxID=373672 RepID=UPI003D0EA0C8
MGGLKKIEIIAKENKSQKFVALINPTKYSLSFKNDLNKESPPGSPQTEVKFNKVISPDLDLEILLDGTGITEENTGNTLINKIINKKATKTNVATKLEDFLMTTGTYDGNIHKPFDVTITWGILSFEGVLNSFTVDFTLFSPEGYPLRAIIKAKFTGSTEIKLTEAKAKRNSPDLSHKRTVQAGDTLPLMTKRIYGDSKYYLEVAKVNNLINFRQLKPGTELYFPPIEKIA